MATQTANSETYRVPVILQPLPKLRYADDNWTSRQDRQLAIGSISVLILDKLFKVDRRSPDNQEGYQREAVKARVNSLKQVLQNRRVDLPTAILLNLRDFDRDRHIQSIQSTVPADRLVELRLCSGDRLYIVDGQHRVEALLSLFKEDREKWGDYSLPFVCLLGADRDGEMNEFHVVNSNAKSIGTGLAQELLRQRAGLEGVKEYLTETGKVWIANAGILTKKLSESEIWRGRIQYPGQRKGNTLITNNGLTTSLRLLVEQPGVFQALNDKDQQARVLNAYWEGIGQVLPEVMRDPEEYNLQRTLGVTALHAVLVNVLAIMMSKGHSVFDPAKYAEIMRVPLEQLSGQTPEGVEVEGTAFWKRGAEGASGLFNSRTGRRVLEAQIRGKLPALSVQ